MMNQTDWTTVPKVHLSGSEVFSAHCERLMLVDTIERALWFTRHLEDATNLCPEDQCLKNWRETAKECLRIELLRRAPLPDDLFEENGAADLEEARGG
jgi:hypothetical protein